MKNINFWYLCLVIWLGTGSLSYVQSQVGSQLNDDEQLIEFTTDRFTLPNLHVTPDKKHIIFDVLGDIYQVPIEGGKAEVLLQDSNWKRAGKLSPDGKTLAYISDENGYFQVWTFNLQTKEKKAYPIIFPYYMPLNAYWSSKGQLLIPSKDGLQTHITKHDKMKILRPAKEDEKSISHFINRTMIADKSGANIFYQKKNKLFVYDLESKIDSVLAIIPEEYTLMGANVYSREGLFIFYTNRQEISGYQDLIAWKLKDNSKKVLETTKKLGTTTSLNYSFDFIDEHTIVLDKEGEIVRVDLETGGYKPIPIEVGVRKVIKKPLHRMPQHIRDSVITASVLRNPVTRPNLDTIYFGAFGKLHTYAKTTGKIKEIYPDKNRFEVSPSLSPNGKYLAYTTWNDWEMGHLYVRELQTGEEIQITTTPGRYINPSWSSNGKELVFLSDNTEARLSINSQASQSSPNYLVYNIDIYKIRAIESGIIKSSKPSLIKRITPSTNLSRRFYPTVTFSPNGQHLFFNTRNNKDKLSVIQKLNFESREIVQEYRLPHHIDEVMISPNKEHIAFIFDDQVWINQFPYQAQLKFSPNTAFLEKRLYVDGGYVHKVILPTAKKIYEEAPSYLYWQDKNTLMWGAAEDIYTYDVRTQKTKKIAEIKVQKPRAVPKTNYAFTHARIITVNDQDKIIEKGTILIKNNRIEAVGLDGEIHIPEDYKVFDMTGKTITPGLIDVHAHYHHGPYEFTNQQEYQYIGNLAFGVTTIYDPSVNVLDYREQAQMVETGVILGPRVFSSGNVIMADPKDYDYRSIKEPCDAHRIVKSYKKLGVSGPIKQYHNDNRLHRRWIYNSAKKYGMSLTNHQVSLVPALTQIIDGYTGSEHQKYSFTIQNDIIQFFGKSGVNYTPTFMVSPRIGDLFLNKVKMQNDKLLKFNGDILYQNNFAYHSLGFDSDPQKEEFKKKDLLKRKKEIKKSAKTLKDIVNADGIVSVGGHGNPLPGISTHMEMWSFTYGGLSNYEAIKTATINGAKKIDMQEEIGSIKQGKLADLVILNSDPLKNIFNTTDIKFVVQNGNIYNANSMEKIYPIKKELKEWGWENPLNIQRMDTILIMK